MSTNKQPEMQFGKRLLGAGNPVFIIAEIGTSHQGDLIKAEELIAAAAEAGADCAKFQYVIAKEIIHPNTGNVPLPGGEIPLYKRFTELERPPDFYSRLKEITEKHKLFFLCTPFGIKSTGNLKKIGIEGYKIASPESNHYPLLNELGSLPVILSTGVSSLGDIERALMAITGKTALLHCITAYPAKEKEYNLQVIPALSTLFGVPVGVSDHSRDPILVPVLTCALGGSIIEKHFTLSRKTDGLDDPIAITPEDFSIMCREVKAAEKRDFQATIDILEGIFGKVRVTQTLGTGIKKLASGEMENYMTTNRSIMAACDIQKGENYTVDNTALLRSEKELKPGLPPHFYPEVLKRKARASIKSGTGITWECI